MLTGVQEIMGKNLNKRLIINEEIMNEEKKLLQRIRILSYDYSYLSKKGFVAEASEVQEEINNLKKELKSHV